MKIILAILLSVTLVGCGTLGGAMSGAGEDMKRAGDWVKKI
jgi:predicted small secreted protein